LCHLWALGQLASVELSKVTSKSTAFQLLLLLALEQLLLIEVTLLQLAGETFPDEVRLPKLRLSSLGSLQEVSLSNILLQIQVVHCVQLLSRAPL
jgi:hypothetical protein